jgi:hypothetical protein
MLKFFTTTIGVSALLLAASAGTARAGLLVTVSVGYYDLPPGTPNSSFTNPLPNPWYGTATSFLGDSVTASAADPDEAGVLLSNTGTVSVTLSQGFNINYGSSLQVWDALIGAGGLTLAPGQTVVLSGTTSTNMDLSEFTFSQNPVISFTLNSTPYSFTDTGRILHGGAISANETEPWTQIGQIGVNSTPEPSTLLLSMAGLGIAALIQRRRRP